MPKSKIMQAIREEFEERGHKWVNAGILISRVPNEHSELAIKCVHELVQKGVLDTQNIYYGTLYRRSMKDLYGE